MYIKWRWGLSPQSEWTSFKSLQITNGGEGGGKREPSYNWWWECKLMQSLRKTDMEVPQKTKSRIIMWSSNPTLGHICGQNSNLKRNTRPCIHSSQDTETTEMSTDSSTDKEGVVRRDTTEYIGIYNGILLGLKRKWNNAMCSSNMGGSRDYHTEKKIRKDKYYMIPLIG